jgi:hypothetical protein
MWADEPAIAHAMFDAYRFWAPRFEAAALLEAALPYIRADARSSLAERMDKLSSAATADEHRSSDALQLRRETLALIRSALREAPRTKRSDRIE